MIMWQMDDQKKPCIIWEFREQGGQVVSSCFGPHPDVPGGEMMAPAFFFVVFFPHLNQWKARRRTLSCGGGRRLQQP